MRTSFVRVVRATSRIARVTRDTDGGTALFGWHDRHTAAQTAGRQLQL